MAYRDRAAGWKHAKLTGHKNEELAKQLLAQNTVYAHSFVQRIGCSGGIIATQVGGLHETNVVSVNGGRKTKSKTDLKVWLENGKELNISIKKSLGGQVYFVGAGLFIDTFERQFGKEIPEKVQRAIGLFWNNASDAEEIIKEYGDDSNEKEYSLQLRHRSLNATTLLNYSKELYNDLLCWFIQNAYEITALCFSMGAAADDKEWSQYIWYINLLSENSVDDIFSIEQICLAAQRVAQYETYYSSKNGGTTIQLPFGFVQWHQGKLQFHHNYGKIKMLISGE